MHELLGVQQKPGFVLSYAPFPMNAGAAKVSLELLNK